MIFFSHVLEQCFQFLSILFSLTHIPRLYFHSFSNSNFHRNFCTNVCHVQCLFFSHILKFTQEVWRENNRFFPVKFLICSSKITNYYHKCVFLLPPSNFHNSPDKFPSAPNNAERDLWSRSKDLCRSCFCLFYGHKFRYTSKKWRTSQDQINTVDVLK